MVSGEVMVNNLARRITSQTKEKLVKKNFGLVGMSVMVLALGFLFTACEQVQEVTGSVEVSSPKVSAVSGVDAKTTSNGEYVILRWNAVGDGGDYYLYYHEEGKKTIGNLSSSGNNNAQNLNTYSLLDGTSTDNDDVDKWSARVSIRGYGYASSLFGGKKVQFGIRTIPILGSNGASSDIVWSPYLEF
jgi:hypothetical protein